MEISQQSREEGVNGKTAVFDMEEHIEADERNRVTLNILLVEYQDAVIKGDEKKRGMAREKMLAKINGCYADSPGVCNTYIMHLLEQERDCVLERGRSIEYFFKVADYALQRNLKTHPKKCIRRIVESNGCDISLVIKETERIGLHELAKEITKKYLKDRRHTAYICTRQ